MDLDGSRRAVLVGGTALVLTYATRTASLARAESPPEVTVYKSPT